VSVLRLVGEPLAVVSGEMKAPWTETDGECI